MSLFRKSPAVARDRALSDVAKLEQTLAEQRAKRPQLLLEADDVSALATLDAAISANERALEIQKQRIEALTGEARRQDRDRLEKERQDAIGNIVSPRLSKIEKLAADVERQFLAFTTSYSLLQAAVKEFNSEFPASIPRPRHAYYLSIAAVERQVATALDRGRWNGPADAAKVAEGIAETVQHAAARYIGTLRATPLPEPIANEERAA